MNMFEEARSLSGTMKMCGFTQNDIAKRLGVSQSYVANKLRLLSYSDRMQSDILDSGISERHARAVLRLKDEEDRRRALDKIISEGLTVRESEALVDMMYDDYAPQLLSQAGALERIDKFKQMIKSSVTVLKSCGVRAREHTEYHAGKAYISIIIDEEITDPM